MSKSLSRAASAMLSAGAAIVALALTTPGYAQSDAPIKIGVIAEAQAVAGSSIPQAAQMAADEINAAGGVNGRKIEIVTYDDHSSAAGSGARLPARGERGSRQRGDRQLYQRGRAGARTVDRPPEDRDGHARRRFRRHHAKHRQGLRQSQIHVPRLSDVDEPRRPGLRRCEGPSGEGPSHEDRRGHERGRRLDHAARRRIPQLSAESRAQGRRPYPLLARHHGFHADLQQDRG